jgi:hypothetical protein
MNYENIVSNLPKDIASKIFNDTPEEPKTYSLVCQEMENDTSMSDVFEIFLTILIEGFFIKYPINKETIKNLTPDFFTNLQPWLSSIGINVNVNTTSLSDVESYNNYYCKIILREDPAWNIYFELHENITENYHFIFGGNSPLFHKQQCHLNNLFAIFVLNDTVFKISFSLL